MSLQLKTIGEVENFKTLAKSEGIVYNYAFRFGQYIINLLDSKKNKEFLQNYGYEF